MQVAILGALEVRDDDGTPRVVAGARVRGLLARLALDAGRVVPADVLVDEVWGADVPAEPANALQSLVSRLRRALGDAGLVVQEARGYRLAVRRDQVDVTRLADLLDRVATAAQADKPALLQQATELARGPVVAEVAEVHGPRLDELVLSARSQLLDVDLADPLTDPADLVRRAADLARAHPLHEHLTGQLMTALHRQGRTAEALTAYEDLRRLLAEELGTDPSGELQTLHLQLLQDAPVVAVPRPARATNLRAGITSFLGREDEAKRLHRLLDEGRLATVVGPGGAGKTRLSGVVAADWVDRTPDGVWFVELAPVTDPAALPQAFLAALGPQVHGVLERQKERASVATVDRLMDALADSDCLLVVDNCEHLIGPVAELVEDLLAACPGLRVLATSREPLGIDGEALCLLPPLLLPKPDADVATALTHASVQLFADRAKAADADFAVDASTVADVVEIVRRLDGLPLAIELAAARLRVLPVHEIAARLGDRFRLLSGGRRTAMPRHRTLRAVVEWSWTLLSDDERFLAERLAVFPAGATADAAAAIAPDLDVADVEDLLDALVDKSLLRLDTTGGLRYRMLETIREYGTERLVDDGTVDEVRLLHALHYAAFVAAAEPHLRSADQLVWLRRVDAEQGNLIAAMQHLAVAAQADTLLGMASSLGMYWTLNGNHSDAATWLETALAVPGGTDASARLVGEAVMAINSMAGGLEGDPPGSEAGRRRGERLADIARRIDEIGLDGSQQSLVLLRPMMAFFGGEPAELLRLMDLSLQVADPWTRATLIMFRANLAENEGDVEGNRADVTQALAGFQALGERWGTASCLAQLGQLSMLEGELPLARDQLRDAIVQLEEFGANGDLAFVRARLVDVLVRTGDLDGARRELVRMAETAGSRLARIMCEASQAMVAQAEGDAAGLHRVRDRIATAVGELGPVHPLNGHLKALSISTLVGIDVALDAPVDPGLVVEAYDTGAGTRDMPVISGVGLAVAAAALQWGRAVEAARMLGASARLQGALDATDPRVVFVQAGLREALGATGWQDAYEDGRGLSREEAIAVLDPRTVLDPVTAP